MSVARTVAPIATGVSVARTVAPSAIGVSVAQTVAPSAIGVSVARTVAPHNHYTSQSELLTLSLSNHSVWRRRGEPQKTRFFVRSPHLTVHIINLGASMHFMFIDFSDTISVRLRHLAL